MIKLVSIWLLASFSLATSFTFLQSAEAACVASARVANLANGAVRMKAYSCSLNDAGKPVVEVEFDRLSEAAAGSIIEGSPYEDLNVLYRSGSVLHNEVYRQAKSLFDAYAIRLYDEDCYVVHVSSAEGGAYDAKSNSNDRCDGKRVLWYLTFPDQEHLTTKGYPESWGAKLVNNKWPAVWSFYYRDCSTGTTDLLSCVVLWRYLSQSDLNNYLKDVKANEIKIGAPMVRKSRFDDTQSVDSKRDRESDRYFSLVDHIANGNLPSDFLVLVDSNVVSCGCGSEGDGIHIRNLLMHTAIIRNISDRPLTIDGLNVGRDESSDLRTYSDGQKPASFAITPITSVTISPGDTLIIPLRLNFVPSDSLGDVFHDLPAATRTHSRIASAPGEFIRSSCEGSAIKVTKSEFAPPSRPTPRTYSYGPALTLKGVSIGGVEVDFDRPLSNFFQIAAGSGYGSCPYLYAMDAGEREWVRHGKVIDDASSPAKEMTQQLELPGAVTRFKISEEELELTFVHKVRLELALADGRMISLRPRNRLRPESADHYDKIKYGAEREYDFDLPVDVNPANVLKSTLSVTGYYLRYSTAASINSRDKK
jgi:hypothetical protein